jgi:hypothetical protein
MRGDIKGVVLRDAGESDNREEDFPGLPYFTIDVDRHFGGTLRVANSPLKKPASRAEL